MTDTPWNTHLEEATTHGAVITVCDRYVTACTFEELGKIPAGCQPYEVLAPADVGPYALKLAARLQEGDSAAPLQRMSAFFTQAAQRLAQIEAARPEPYPADHEQQLGGFRHR